MPSETFFSTKKKAMEIINRSNDIRMIDMEVSFLHDDYEKAKEKILKIATYLKETLPKLKAKGFEENLLEISTEAAINALWESSQEEFHNMVEDRYSDIIKIFENGSKKSDTK